MPPCSARVSKVCSRLSRLGAADAVNVDGVVDDSHRDIIHCSSAFRGSGPPRRGPAGGQRAALGEPADQRLGAVRDVGVQGQHGLGADDALDPQDGPQGGLEVVRVRRHHPAPDVAAAGDLVDLQDLGDQPQGPHHAVEFPVVHLDRHEGDDVVAHRLQIDFAAAVVQHAGAQHAPHAGLGGVPGDAQGVAEFADLDPRDPGSAPAGSSGRWGPGCSNHHSGSLRQSRE